MMKTAVRLLSSAIGAWVLALPVAGAQTPGEYTGQDSDGFSVSLVVYQNPRGELLLSLVRASAYFYCNGQLLLTNGQKTAYGAALFADAPIKQGAAMFAGSSNRLSALSGTVQFDGNTASGFLVGYAPFYVGLKTPPSNAEALSCETHGLAFKAAYFKPLARK